MSCPAHLKHSELSTARKALGKDLERYLEHSPEWGSHTGRRIVALLTPNLRCLALYRLAHCLFAKGWLRTATFVGRVNGLLNKATIPAQSCIGEGCFLPHPAGVTFVGTAGPGLTLYSMAICCPADTGGEGPTLGARVTVGAYAVLIGPISVGSDTKIAYSIRLDRDAPAESLVISRWLRLALRSRNGNTPVLPS